MSEIRFRLAKPSDAKQIAYVHYHIRDKYDQGFFAEVNYSFLKAYYEVVLNDPCEVVVCAEDENQKIVGFSSGSLDSERQFQMMRKKKARFVWPLLTSAVSKPQLIKNAFDRFKSTQGESSQKFITTKGARLEYWGWLPNRDDSDLSPKMQELLFYVMKLMGATQLFFEVDKINKRIFKFHKINGAEEVNTFTMPDGRERVELVYDMNNYNFKF